MFTKELLKRQKSDGRWVSPAFEERIVKGHGEQMFKGLDQPIYSTALCCLMLEVYYRYLPTFKVMKHKKNILAETDEDLGIELQ